MNNSDQSKAALTVLRKLADVLKELDGKRFACQQRESRISSSAAWLTDTGRTVIEAELDDLQREHDARVCEVAALIGDIHACVGDSAFASDAQLLLRLVDSQSYDESIRARFLFLSEPHDEPWPTVRGALDSLFRASRTSDWLTSRVCDALGEKAGVTLPDTTTIMVNRAEMKALEILSSSPILLTSRDLEVCTSLSKTALLAYLRRMEIEVRLVERPQGPNRGYALTPLGRAYMKCASERLPKADDTRES